MPEGCELELELPKASSRIRRLGGRRGARQGRRLCLRASHCRLDGSGHDFGKARGGLQRRCIGRLGRCEVHALLPVPTAVPRPIAVAVAILAFSFSVRLSFPFLLLHMP